MTTAWIKTADNLLLYANPEVDADDVFGSAITRLIYGISEEFGEERLRYLRQRIFSMYPPNLWERNLIKVCAKRSATLSTFETKEIAEHKKIDIGRNLTPDPNSCRHPELVGTTLRSVDAIDLVNKLATKEKSNQREKHLRLHEAPRAISAIICDPDDKIMGIFVNTNATCQMRHAEVNLFLHLKASGLTQIPQGTKVYTSLKPCRMCAALICSYGTKHPNHGLPDIKVFSSKDDPGPFGRHNLLEGVLTIVEPPTTAP